LKDDRQQSTCGNMTMRLIRQLLTMLMVAVLIGAPAVQAAFTMPCHAVAASPSDQDHRLISDPTSVPVPMPCKGVTPGCLDMLDCGLSAGLPAQAVGESQKLIWTSAVYPISSDMHEGLSVKPDLGPPITI
jgi:hypothetical protein